MLKLPPIASAIIARAWQANIGQNDGTADNVRWDDHLKLWIGYVRLDSGTQNRRRTGRTTSKDFLTWTKAEQVFEGQHGYEICAPSAFLLAPPRARPYLL